MREKNDWERISAEHQGELLREAQRRIGERFRAKFDPQSAVQEALATAFENRAQFRGSTARELRGYLLQILKNTILDRLRGLRRQKRNAALEVPLAEERGSSRRVQRAASSRWNAERQLEVRQARQRVLEGIAQLPAPEREVLERELLHDLSHQSIARELGRSPGDVRRLSSLGNKRLRALLKAARKDE